ncbi:uncharacterized protein METZ01_LOCUS251777, partial [marine metagenome]
LILLPEQTKYLLNGEVFMRLVAFMFLALGTDMVLAADNVLGFDA